MTARFTDLALGGRGRAPAPKLTQPQPPGCRTSPIRQGIGVGGPYFGCGVAAARTGDAGCWQVTAVIAPSAQAVPAIRDTTTR